MAAVSKVEESRTEERTQPELYAPAWGPPGRLISLDVFRGITIAAMILVNNPGSWSNVYWPLRHAEWNGWTPTDLIFPFFLFIVGISMTLSFARRLSKGETRLRLMRQLIRRSLIIFALGLFLNGYPYFNLGTIRIPGVLQRIAVCYFLAGMIYLFTNLRGQAIAFTGLLAGYWLAMAFIPVPGIGRAGFAMDRNLAAYIDNLLMHGHIYKPTWDPEGILSSFPATATVLLAILAGRWLQHEVPPQRRILGFLAGGVACVVLGQMMNGWIPINKNLWTSSYVVFTGGAALILFGLCYWIMDVRGLRLWSLPFVVFGVNAIAVYVFDGIIGKSSVIWAVHQVEGKQVLIKTFLYNNFFVPLASPYHASVLWALAHVLICLGFVWILYWRKIYIKV